jgi:hypothetical protein
MYFAPETPMPQAFLAHRACERGLNASRPYEDLTNQFGAEERQVPERT